MKQKFRVLWLAWLLLAVAAHSQGEGKGELLEGEIHSYVLGKGNIVINDTLFDMASNVKVYDEKKRAVSRAALTKGREVRFRIQYRSDGWRPIVLEINLLKEGR